MYMYCRFVGVSEQTDTQTETQKQTQIYKMNVAFFSVEVLVWIGK